MLSSESMNKFWGSHRELCTASTLSAIYALTGFPFDVRAANLQIGNKLQIKQCILSNGLPFTSGTAFVREWIGLSTIKGARKWISEQMDEDSWEQNKRPINFACGLSRAISDAIIGNPIIIAKQMVFTKQANNGRQAVLQRYQEEKSLIKAFYKRTFFLTGARNCLGSGLQLMLFAEFSSQNDSKPQQILKGGAINIAIGLSTFPIDRIRNRLIHDTNLTCWRKAAQSIYTTHGILGFYSGYGAMVCKMFASGAVSSFGMRAVLQKDPKTSPQEKAS
jgi:hypothetical protein